MLTKELGRLAKWLRILKIRHDNIGKLTTTG